MSSCEPDIFPSISSRIRVHAVRQTDDASTWTPTAAPTTLECANGNSRINGAEDEEEDFVAEVRVSQCLLAIRTLNFKINDE